MYNHFILVFLVLLGLNKAFAYNELTIIKETPVFDLNSFIQRVNSSTDPKTIESTLIELKKEDPSFFKNYVLMYKSRSLQTSSFMYPRVLLSSQNSTTVITYNGNSNDHGHNKLEVMRFNPETTKFTFNEISFNQNGLELSKDNPTKCMSCHQNSSRTSNDPRPNWEPYSIWPGAYSSLAVGGNGLFNPNSPKHDPILASNAKSENEMYQRFLNEITPTHPRYNLLEPMVLSNLGQYFPAIGTPSDAPNKFTTTFTDNLMNLNALRIARLIADTQIISDYHDVIYAVAKCKRLYLPKDIFDWHKGYIHQDLQETFSLEDFARVIELVFHPYSISTQDWSMDFGTGGKFAFRHRFGGPDSFDTSFKIALELTTPSLKSKSCADLKSSIFTNDFSKTLDYRKAQDLAFLENTSAKPNLLNRCASCHTSSSFRAPFISFNDELRLSAELKENGYPRGNLKEEILYRIGTHAEFFERMPADGYIPTTNEIESFIKYIESL